MMKAWSNPLFRMKIKSCAGCPAVVLVNEKGHMSKCCGKLNVKREYGSSTYHPPIPEADGLIRPDCPLPEAGNDE